LKTKILLFCVTFFLFFDLFSNETVNSYHEDYLETLFLQGEIDTPYLNYGSYSSNKWDESGNGLWKDQRKEEEYFHITENSYFTILDTSLFQSYNLNTPHGMNDGSLWQGRGYNMQLDGGIAFKSPCVDIIIDPELNFSQNLDYDIQEASRYSGSEYGYMYYGIDLPQRFGDDALGYWDYGQSQIRFNYNSWTLGFGNEEVWIGPGEQNALILSNNAGGFPHIDFGLNKTETRFGDMEFRMWWGWLKSSEYFEKAPDEYQDFISGLSISYAPSFLPELVIGFHRTAQVSFNDYTYESILEPLNFGITSGMLEFGQDETDGRASLTFSWLFPASGAEFYGEWMREDYSPNISGWIETPEHTAAYTLGFKKNIFLKNREKYFELNGELSSTVWSMDYMLSDSWGGGFYRHHKTNLGYTSQGQILGAGIGSASNYQYLGLDFYAPFGKLGTYISRYKQDDTLLYSLDGSDDNNDRIPVEIAAGLSGSYFINKKSILSLEVAYIFNKNWNLEADNDLHGIYISTLYSYRF